ncbi:MAG: ATP-binding cassette domain-containing protein [Chloroflexaceae bacterium]|nr:ATP-binding cassette domain-containing protein [Chloroflexaceae bacterium]
MSAIIEVQNLVKTYPDGTEAVRGISFDVAEGEFFGFLGPNGAGKTTTIKIIITLMPYTSGQVLVMGFDRAHQANAIRQVIGYAPQDVGVDDDLTGRENLLMQGELFHMKHTALRQRVDELLDLMDLTNDAERPAGSYSGGMRKRLDLATGLMHRPRILFLDEPTTGLDPQNRANLWVYLERLNQQEHLTIFLTTHYMEEADRLCHRLAIIDHGEIRTIGSPRNLKQDIGGDVISLRFQSNGMPLPEQCEQARDLLAAAPFALGADLFDEGVNVYAQQGGTVVPELIRLLEDHDLKVAQLSLTSPSLDDVFLKHTGHQIRQEGPIENWRNRRGGFGRSRRRR